MSDTLRSRLLEWVFTRRKILEREAHGQSTASTVSNYPSPRLNVVIRIDRFGYSDTSLSAGSRSESDGGGDDAVGQHHRRRRHSEGLSDVCAVAASSHTAAAQLRAIASRRRCCGLRARCVLQQGTLQCPTLDPTVAYAHTHIRALCLVVTYAIMFDHQLIAVKLVCSLISCPWLQSLLRSLCSWDFSKAQR